MPSSNRRNTQSLFPAFVGTLDHVRGDIGNLVITQTSSKSGHGVLSARDLGDDRLFRASSGQVLVQGFLFQGLVGHDHVLSTCVACGAVGIEHLFAVSGVAGECGLGGDKSGDTGGGGSLGNLKEQDTGGCVSDDDGFFFLKLVHVAS